MRALAKVRAARVPVAQRQLGFGLIELMIAMLIGLFIVFGLTLVFMNMKGASVSQDQLAGLQDKERLALSVLTTTIQSARYFPDPLATIVDVALPAAPAATLHAAFAAGQGITGTAAGAASNSFDTITSRYVTASGEVVMDCLGGINTSGANLPVSNTFWLDSSAKELKCSLDGGTNSTTLVSGVVGLQVLYGTDTSGSGTDMYLDASKVELGGYWPAVRTVRITVKFANPYYNTNGSTPGQPQTIDWNQTINLMNQT